MILTLLRDWARPLTNTTAHEHDRLQPQTALGDSFVLGCDTAQSAYLSYFLSTT